MIEFGPDVSSNSLKNQRVLHELRGKFLRQIWIISVFIILFQFTSFIVFFRSLGNGVYQLNYVNSPDKYQVYCHMTEINGCEGKAWTLVMKMDGAKVKNIAR